MKNNTLRQRRRVATECKDDGLTEQSHAKSCDIHNILTQYEKTGVITHNAKHQGQYMDYPNSHDFKAMMDTVAEAKSMFESIPATIRKDFANDAGRFLDFMQNEDNREAIEAYGFTTNHLPPLPEVDATPAGGGDSPLPSGEEQTSEQRVREERQRR